MLDRIRLENFGPGGRTLQHLDIEFNKLNVFCGDNGIGKSLLFKIAFVMSTGLNIYKILLASAPTEADKLFKANMDVVLETTFSDAGQMQGAVIISDKDEAIYNFMIVLKDGKLDHFSLNVLDTEAFHLGEINSVNYNSKEARTFNQYDTYIKLKKRFDFEMSKGNDAILEMAEFYRLYDMMWFEKVQQDIRAYAKGEKDLPLKIEHWNTIFKEQPRGEANSGMPDANNFVFAKDTVFVDDLGDLRRLASYSAGIQSLVMLNFFAS